MDINNKFKCDGVEARNTPEDSIAQPVRSATHGMNRSGLSASLSIKRTISAAGILLLAMTALAYFNRVGDIPLKKPLAEFPRQIESWSGRDMRFDESVYRVLGVDDTVLCNYSSPEGNQVSLYVGFYKSQREGDIIHSPRNCMPGGGWNITKNSIEDLHGSTDLYKGVKATKLMVEKGSEKQIILYWYQAQGRFVASEFAQKFLLAYGCIINHRTDGAFVRLSMPVMQGDEEGAIRCLRSFAGHLLPRLAEFLPS